MSLSFFLSPCFSFYPFSFALLGSVRRSAEAATPGHHRQLTRADLSSAEYLTAVWFKSLLCICSLHKKNVCEFSPLVG